MPLLPPHLLRGIEDPAKQEKLRARERIAYAAGYRRVAGIDEAGRGPLAGPVVAAAVVILKEENLPPVEDSKKLRPAQRQVLFEALCAHPYIQYGVAMVDAQTIDEINIYQASLEAMRAAIAALPEPPDALLVDGVALTYKELVGEKIIAGDAHVYAIAAASILAKVSRDAHMMEWDARFPHFGFARHKGYGTPQHLAALRQYGVTSIHRRSFAPVRAALDQMNQEAAG